MKREKVLGESFASITKTTNCKELFGDNILWMPVVIGFTLDKHTDMKKESCNVSPQLAAHMCTPLRLKTVRRRSDRGEHI